MRGKATQMQPGEMVGDLIALREAPDRPHDRRRRWVFRCVCGAEVVRAASLVRAAIAEGREVAGCKRCRLAAHTKRLNESGANAYGLSRAYGERVALSMLERVDIDRDLPETFG